MKTTRLLLAGLLTGAMAVGTACKTDEAQRMPSTPPPAPSMSTDAGTGGAGSMGDIRDREPDMNSPDMNQMPPDHQMPSDQPGTGGSGMDSQDMRGPGTVGNDTIDNPLPQPPPVDSSMKGETQDNISPPQR